MTELLRKAFDEASKLPHEQQDAIASLLIEELESDRNWDRVFEQSQDALAKLAYKALAEDERIFRSWWRQRRGGLPLP